MSNFLPFIGWVLSKVLEPFNVDHKEGANEAFKIFNALTEAVCIHFSLVNPFCQVLPSRRKFSRRFSISKRHKTFSFRLGQSFPGYP